MWCVVAIVKWRLCHVPTCCLNICVCVFSVCSADSIEANVENADISVQSATQQLARAAGYQVKHQTEDGEEN